MAGSIETQPSGLRWDLDREDRRDRKTIRKMKFVKQNHVFEKYAWACIWAYARAG
jgi:hypothetical protein